MEQVRWSRVHKRLAAEVSASWAPSPHLIANLTSPFLPPFACGFVDDHFFFFYAGCGLLVAVMDHAAVSILRSLRRDFEVGVDGYRPSSQRPAVDLYQAPYHVLCKLSKFFMSGAHRTEHIERTASSVAHRMALSSSKQIGPSSGPSKASSGPLFEPLDLDFPN